jgi:hypothetical protein
VADTQTTNYNWVKPGVNDPAGVDAWGGKINTDLDGIDTQVFANAQSVASLWQNIRYRNRIINGDMSVDQRNGGAQIATSGPTGYVIDRWRFQTGVSAGKGTLGQTGPGPLGFQKAQVWQTTAAYAVAAGDYFVIGQNVEGANFNDALWGTAQAQPVILEFWAQSLTAPGTFGGSLRNGANNRSYVFSYTTTGTVWQKFRISIPGDTAGTWNVADNAAALNLCFALGVGTTNSGPPNVWTGSPLLSATGATSIVATLNATLYITGVALMVGAAAANAEPEFRKYSDNLIDCMRYYNKIGFQLGGYNNAAGTIVTNAIMFPQMRATPTTVQSGMSFGNASAASTASSTPSSVTTNITASAAGIAWASGTLSLDADF